MASRHPTPRPPARRPLAGASMGLALLLHAVPAAAQPCPGAPAGASLAQRWQAAPLLFIGTVTTLDADGAGFAVEHALAGVAAGTAWRAAAVPGCTIDWQRGHRWLFAGAAQGAPSLRLDGPGLAPLQRSDDRRAALPPAWQACEADTQCVPLPYVCGLTAVNAASLDAAREDTRRRLGDPRAADCARAPFERLPAPLCHAGRCGVFGLRP